MAMIRDILEFKRKKEKEPISFAEHLERAKERLRQREKRTKQAGQTAEKISLEEYRRLMGDVGPRRFLKDRGNRRK
jgi:hypothetical protein